MCVCVCVCVCMCERLCVGSGCCLQLSVHLSRCIYSDPLSHKDQWISVILLWRMGTREHTHTHTHTHTQYTHIHILTHTHPHTHTHIQNTLLHPSPYQKAISHEAL